MGQRKKSRFYSEREGRPLRKGSEQGNDVRGQLLLNLVSDGL